MSEVDEIVNILRKYRYIVENVIEKPDMIIKSLLAKPRLSRRGYARGWREGVVGG